MTSLDAWLGRQRHRDDPVGEIARAVQAGSTVGKLRKLAVKHPSAQAGAEQAILEFAAV
ncbi:hypothetical protein [Agromyces subbeticus]|uniref:hypothetical protein n=1 Tax=Agromyces subbeticus TaxID=293890 RepID=UPI0003B5E074|nr:hypothetical protein [Agromyces subbeticus]